MPKKSKKSRTTDPNLPDLATRRAILLSMGMASPYQGSTTTSSSSDDSSTSSSDEQSVNPGTTKTSIGDESTACLQTVSQGGATSVAAVGEIERTDDIGREETSKHVGKQVEVITLSSDSETGSKSEVIARETKSSSVSEISESVSTSLGSMTSNIAASTSQVTYEEISLSLDSETGSRSDKITCESQSCMTGKEDSRTIAENASNVETSEKYIQVSDVSIKSPPPSDQMTLGSSSTEPARPSDKDVSDRLKQPDMCEKKFPEAGRKIDKSQKLSEESATPVRRERRLKGKSEDKTKDEESCSSSKGLIKPELPTDQRTEQRAKRLSAKSIKEGSKTVKPVLPAVKVSVRGRKKVRTQINKRAVSTRTKKRKSSGSHTPDIPKKERDKTLSPFSQSEKLPTKRRARSETPTKIKKSRPSRERRRSMIEFGSCSGASQENSEMGRTSDHASELTKQESSKMRSGSKRSPAEIRTSKRGKAKKPVAKKISKERKGKKKT